MPLVRTNILSAQASGKVTFRPGVFLRIEGDRIEAISERCDDPAEDRTHQLCIPGFIDTHAHISQYNARGRASDGLLPWLRDIIFPEEMRSRDAAIARATADSFFDAMLHCGTTTTVCYVSVFAQAVEAAFESARQKGVRAFIGKVMMDQHCPEDLVEDTSLSMRQSEALYHKWDRATSLLRYIFSPRFALVCSERLMRRVGVFASEHDVFIQTHLSENRDEIELVAQLFPQASSYTDVYRRCGILTPQTILGHCIHLSEPETNIIAAHDAAIAHCPDSNFFLGSGVFPWKRIEQAGIRFALASDVGAGTTLSMPEMMRMAAYRQDGWKPSPAVLFRRATLDSARVLGLDSEIGSIEPGKAADLVFLAVPDAAQASLDSLLSRLVYLSAEMPVASVFVAGRRVK
ncbi:MAG: guanine deaminase [Candidatus Cloacimonetes bacterium]|nr:guanine deaminase [Candidatus Cloacimonadota bacterium]